MSIEQKLTTKLKEAMKSKNQKEISVIRMIKSEAGKAKTASGFSGETDDKFWLEVIARYVKQQKKALVEFEKLGDKAVEEIESINYEVSWLAPFLPVMLDKSQVEELVDKAIAQSGAAGSKMVGKIIGMVMKDNKGKVDAAMVKSIAEKKLG